MQEIVHETRALLGEDEPFALVTLIADEGSTPRSAGAEMLVRADGSIAGTVGGGLLEATAMQQAHAVIATGRSTAITVELTGQSVEDAVMLCGGRAQLLVSFVPAGDPELSRICSELAAALQAGRTANLVTVLGPEDSEGGRLVARSLAVDGTVVAGGPLEPDAIAASVSQSSGVHNHELSGGRVLHCETIEPAPVAVICGAGHVGRALAPAAAAVGFDVVVIDDRPEFARRERFPSGARLVVLPDFKRAFESVELGARTYVVVATRGHTHDFTLLEQALQTEAAYIGLMASTRKRKHFFEALLERGHTEQDLERIHSPLGLAIDAETPAELAVSIVAELVKVRAESRRAHARR
jgi:xanthine dehydrogenase accessory factor